ncbi:hypothetical protein BO71DRAFT_93714 [Aspergillus ellipticus CBS 707.79]|uniref:Uncharacterized protein n=1 Tax=Aspergillus ellipticus CBS 707.79 TaxID=1448320 RepID=A0A319CXR4_9EURO|nr:hypothetical protein BO71DRAFT_93714 [Aspergillus ellipticus CBS 707.79]
MSLREIRQPRFSPSSHRTMLADPAPLSFPRSLLIVGFWQGSCIYGPREISPGTRHRVCGLIVVIGRNSEHHLDAQTPGSNLTLYSLPHIGHTSVIPRCLESLGDLQVGNPGRLFDGRSRECSH